MTAGNSPAGFSMASSLPGYGGRGGSGPGRLDQGFRFLDRLQVRVFEPIAALGAPQGHVPDVPLVDGEELADLGPALAVDDAQALLVDEGAGEAQAAAVGAAAALALAPLELLGHVVRSEPGQVEPADLAFQVGPEDRLLVQPAAPGDAPGDGVGQSG